ncbi:MAG: VWA domain-containing protein [Nitrospinota bacterium]|nr:VWA domain-containing protein [Nitrospinota bacterium]
MSFEHPWILLALIPLPFWLRHHWAAAPAMRWNARYSDIHILRRLAGGRTPIMARAPFYFRFVAVALLILALARPQTGSSEVEIVSRGIDIILTLDLSTSMSASDFKPTRLAAAKRALQEFISGRKNDRIGLVVFAAQGYTQCPLTLDYPTLLDFLEKSDIGMLEDGTAIGMAIASAANRLKDSKAKSRIVILLTDGMNNAGAIDPATAARMAKALGIKVYTIGVGKEGIFRQKVKDPMMGQRTIAVRTAIDESLLLRIASLTGGQYYRAQDERKLQMIYKEIDLMEKTDIKTKVYIHKTDWFFWPLFGALALMLLEIIIPATRWRITP